MTTSAYDRELVELFADVARCVLADDTVPKTDSDRQFLWDLQRSYYGFKAPARLVEMCERSTDAVVRSAIWERLRRHEQQHEQRHGLSPLSLADEPMLDLAETTIEGQVNALQTRRRYDPNNHGITRELRDNLLRQEEATRRLRECVELEIPT